MGILKKVEHSDWATPLGPVVKPNGKIRLCGDFKVTLNLCLDVYKHPLPKLEEIFTTLSRGKFFSKINLQQAYLHLGVEEDRQSLLTIKTHQGLFRFTRLPYGIASAPAIWQRTMEQVLQGVCVFLDDICVTAPTEDLHAQRLEQVLERLQE